MTETVVVPIPNAMLNDIDVDVWIPILDVLRPSIARRLKTSVDHIKLTGVKVDIIQDDPNITVMRVFDVREMLYPHDEAYCKITYNIEVTP